MATQMLSKKQMGLNLKNLRMSHGKTTAEVSRDTGLGETALRNYECGLRIPRYKAMFILSEYFGKSVDDIFFTEK